MYLCRLLTVSGPHKVNRSLPDGRRPTFGGCPLDIRRHIRAVGGGDETKRLPSVLSDKARAAALDQTMALGTTRSHSVGHGRPLPT